MNNFMNNSRQNKYIYAMNTLKSSNNANYLIYWQKMAGRSKSPRAGVTLNASHILLQEATIMVNNFMKVDCPKVSKNLFILM